jgi:hypothetical protein
MKSRKRNKKMKKPIFFFKKPIDKLRKMAYNKRAGQKTRLDSTKTDTKQQKRGVLKNENVCI